MSSITQINMNDIPSTVKLFTKGAKTKKIYLKGEPRVAIEEFEKFITSFNLPFDEYITLAKSTSEELKILGSSGSKMKNVSIFIYKENNLIKEQSIGDRGALGIACYGSFLVEFDEPITIQSSRSSYIYYEEYNPIELKPMPKIDKLIDSSSFENVSTKLQEINNLLKIGSDNLKTIMDANNLMYKNSNKLIELIKDLNNKTSILVDGVTFYETIVSQIKGFDDIENIKFIKMDKELNGVDVSLDGNTKANKIDKTLYVESNRKIAGNKKCSDMFTTIFLSLKTVDFENFYASNVIDMSYMFYYVSTLTNLLNFKSINTKNVTNMTGMFQKCTSLQSIDFSNIDLSNVTDISSMFQECTSLQSINGLDKIEFKKVTNYAAAFFKCNKLNGEITISNHSINNYLNMFYDCSTEPNTKFTVNYIDEETKKIAEQMVATKSPESNVILGKLVTQ